MTAKTTGERQELIVSKDGQEFSVTAKNADASLAEEYRRAGYEVRDGAEMRRAG